MIRKCSCEHEFQDTEYGQGMRVFNFLKGKEKARCTVCSTVVTLGGGISPKAKK